MGTSDLVTERLAVIDYGVNNVGSVLNMLRRLDVGADAFQDGAALLAARPTAIVLPGIGKFDRGVRNLRDAGLFDAIGALVEGGAALLGICLGMQLLGRGSEEGTLAGFGFVPAFTRRLQPAPDGRGADGHGWKVPHMGWAETECLDGELFAGLVGGAPPRFYYVHSYHVVCDEPRDVAAHARHGATFTAAVRRGRVFGTQFHPEKSHKFGLAVLGNFAKLVRSPGPAADAQLRDRERDPERPNEARGADAR